MGMLRNRDVERTEGRGRLACSSTSVPTMELAEQILLFLNRIPSWVVQIDALARRKKGMPTEISRPQWITWTLCRIMANAASSRNLPPCRLK
jgi:hypothetical protein